jgi:hypothetical protein
MKPMIVLIAGPYLSGTDGDPVKIAANQAYLEAQCLPVWQRGHLPVIGEWLVHPIARQAGSQASGDPVFNTYQYPVAQRLLQRCDAVLRLPGASRGADMDVASARALGLPVYFSLEEITPLPEQH